MSAFEISGIHVEPGELSFGTMQVGETRGGIQIEVPLMVLNGEREGPALWMDCCVHGDEISGIEVIRRIMREEVAASELSGTIVAAPTLNALAFQIGVHGTPLQATTGSNLDLNAAFPGKPDGTLNERMAYRILHEGIGTCDYAISFHSNYYPAVEFIGLTVCEDQQVLEASLAMAQAFGLPICEQKAPKGGGRLTYSAQQQGKPAFLVELVSTGYIKEHSIDLGVRGMRNVLSHLGMLKCDVEPLGDLKVPPGSYGRGFVYCNRGGLIQFTKEVGEWIAKDDVIAVIRDVYGNVVEEVKAATPGYIRTLLFGPHHEAIYEGGVVASILEKASNREYFRD